MRPVFKDQVLQSSFDKDGFVVIPKFLTAEDVDHLKKEYFDNLHKSGGSKLSDETDFQNDKEITYDFTFIDRNIDYKKLVFDIITATFEKPHKRYLDNYRPIIANFIRKKASGGEVPLHQNWAFVDERKCTSVSIWVPLVDSNEENGTLQIAPGSHKRYGEFRGPMVPWELDTIGEEIIASELTPMNVSAGDAVVLDDSVIHYSNINRTDGLRLTIQLILTPAEATTIHYFLDRELDPSTIYMYQVDDDFFMNTHPWIRPKGKLLKKLKFKQEDLTIEDFRKRLKDPEFGQRKQDFLTRVKRIFSFS